MQHIKWGLGRQPGGQLKPLIMGLSRLVMMSTALLTTACLSSKDLIRDLRAPSEVLWAEAQPWVSGLDQGPKGVRLSFEVRAGTGPVQYKRMCYMGQSADLVSQEQRPDFFKASFFQDPGAADLNQTPCSLPAHLEDQVNQPDRAVVVYFRGGHEHYFVLRDIVMKPVLAYPGNQVP